MNAPILREPYAPLEERTPVEIDGTNVRIYYLSRSLPVLAFIVVAIIAAGVALARLLAPAAPTQSRSVTQVLHDALRDRKPDLATVVDCLYRVPEIPAEIGQEIGKSHFPAGAKTLLNGLVISLKDGVNEPSAPLLVLAHQAPPEPGASEVVADLYARQGEVAKARTYYQRELALNPHGSARSKMVALVVESGATEELAQLAADPLNQGVISGSLKLKLALQRGDWTGAMTLFLQQQKASLRPQVVIMALTAGLAWLAIALHAGQPHHWWSFRMMAPPVAAALGAAGGLFAQFLTVAQRDLFGIATNGTFLHDLGYYAGIVAPRDTILQMILFVPFLPLLLRRKSGLDTMVVTGCVGLGFAIVGNLELCKQLPPADSLGRLLTANFFHFAGAALIGLCVCRCLARERGAASATMGTLLAVMLTQGVYDAFTRISGAHVLMILATIAFLIVSRVFFMELRKWRDSFTDQCFLGATLVISLGLMVATVLVTVAAESGLENASWALLRNLPTLLMVSVVFFGQFKRGFAPIGSDLTVPRYS